jgi:hypothetical protein
MLKKVVLSFGPSQAGSTGLGTGVKKPQYSMWKKKQDLSMQSEWDKLQRDTEKNGSVARSETRSSQAPDIELLEAEARPQL